MLEICAISHSHLLAFGEAVEPSADGAWLANGQATPQFPAGAIVCNSFIIYASISLPKAVWNRAERS